MQNVLLKWQNFDPVARYEAANQHPIDLEKALIIMPHVPSKDDEEDEEFDDSDNPHYEGFLVATSEQVEAFIESLDELGGVWDFEYNLNLSGEEIAEQISCQDITQEEADFLVEYVCARDTRCYGVIPFWWNWQDVLKELENKTK